MTQMMSVSMAAGASADLLAENRVSGARGEEAKSQGEQEKFLHGMVR